MSLPPHSFGVPTLTGAFFLLSVMLCLLATALSSVTCILLALFGPLFASAILYFQYLTASFAEIPGGGVPLKPTQRLGAKERLLANIPFRQRRVPLCLGYSRYLLSYLRCVRLSERNALAPGAYVPANARGSLPHRSLISATLAPSCLQRLRRSLRVVHRQMKRT